MDKSKTYIVWDKEDGLVAAGTYEECQKIYEEYVKSVESNFIDWSEIDESDIGDQLVLAKAERRFGWFGNPEGGLSLEELSGTDLLI